MKKRVGLKYKSSTSAFGIVMADKASSSGLRLVLFELASGMPIDEIEENLFSFLRSNL